MILSLNNRHIPDYNIQRITVFEQTCNNNSSMLSKFPKTQPLKPSSNSRKQYFDINKKKLRCFVKKDNVVQDSASDQECQKPIQLKQIHTSKNKQNQQQRKDRVEDSPDIARKIVNDIICKIQTHGLEFQQSDPEDQQTFKRKSLSPVGNQFSANNIWKKDWSTHSIDKSFYSTQGNYSCLSFKNCTSKQYPSTHRSSTTSFSNYQQPLYSIQCQTSFYYQQPTRISYEIVFDRILADGRTTMMIKNIPNKYSLSVLADEIDATHLGQYDFLYLPFDYTSKCNMGYAFINFLSAESLKKFYEIYNFRKWLKYKSEKICELTYARLQGRASLVDHFHTSKVFNQKGKNYRPIFKDFSEIKEIIAKQKSNSFNETYVPTHF